MYVIAANKVPCHHNAWNKNRKKYWDNMLNLTYTSIWDFYNDDNDFIFERREGYSGAVCEFKSKHDYLMFVLKNT
jgi:hypothetical protein